MSLRGLNRTGLAGFQKFFALAGVVAWRWGRVCGGLGWGKGMARGVRNRRPWDNLAQPLWSLVLDAL